MNKKFLLTLSFAASTLGAGISAGNANVFCTSSEPISDMNATQICTKLCGEGNWTETYATHRNKDKQITESCECKDKPKGCKEPKD